MGSIVSCLRSTGYLRLGHGRLGWGASNPGHVHVNCLQSQNEGNHRDDEKNISEVGRYDGKVPLVIFWSEYSNTLRWMAVFAKSPNCPTSTA